MEWSDLAERVQLAGQGAFGEGFRWGIRGEPELHRDLRGVFFDPGTLVLLEDGKETISTDPVLSVHLADFSAYPGYPNCETMFLIGPDGRFYQPQEVRPDGEGDANLILRETFPGGGPGGHGTPDEVTNRYE